MKILKNKSNYLLTTSLGLLASCASLNVNLNDKIKPDEMEVVAQKSWYFNARKQSGGDFGISNKHRDFWFMGGVYTSDEEGGSQLTLYPRAYWVPFELCLACESKLYKVSLEGRVGAGVLMNLDNWSKEVKIEGNSDLFKFNISPAPKIPEIHSGAGIAGDVHLELRFGLLSTGYSALITDREKMLAHIVSVGGRY